MPSLTKNRIEEFINGLTLQTRLIIEPKVDGFTIAIQYIDGELVNATSRKGADVTNNVKKIPDVPNQIAIKGLF